MSFVTHKGLLVWFGLVLLFSLFSRWHVYHRSATRCSLDGNRIVPVYRVDLMLAGDTLESFCCVRCAREWPDVPAGINWRVYDEITKAALDAAKACFVESEVVTVPSRQDRTHVFANWADAMTHADAYDGDRVPNPFETPESDSNQ